MKTVLGLCLVCIAILTEPFVGCGAGFFLRAQSGGATTGEVLGFVRDVQEAAVGSVTVVARNLGTNLFRRTETDAAGRYRFPQLPPGDYEITAEAPGFTKQVARPTVTLGTSVTVDYTLNLEKTEDIVEVRASDDSFRRNQVRRKTESGAIFNRRLINDLPINQRDFLDFSRLSARVAEDRIPAQGVSSTSKLSFNGQASRLNNLNVDGLDNNDYGVGSTRSTFSQEAVREFQVVSDGFSVEFGRSLGGIVNIVTRGGSNEAHGTLFGFFRDDTLAARDAFSPFEPPFEQTQFGAAGGGHVKRDKAFFFASFERRTILQNNIVTIRDETVASARGQGFSIRNGPIPFSVAGTNFLGRLDGNPNPENTLWLRFTRTYTYDGNFEPFGGLTAETLTGLLRRRETAVAAGFMHVNANLNLVNEIRFLYSKLDQDVQPAGHGVQVSLPSPEGIVMFGQGVTVPGARKFDTLHVTEGVSLTRGRHQVKFGGDFLRSPGRALQSFISGGSAGFSPLSFSVPGRAPITFTALQAFDPSLRTPEQQAFLRFLGTVLPQQFPFFPQVRLDRSGLPLAYTQGFGQPSLDPGPTYFSVYGQEEATVGSNLLIKAGLRYDRQFFSLLPSGAGNFSPRLAVSYNPAWCPRLNVRAGFGLFFGVSPFVPSVFSGLSTSGRLKVYTLPFPYSVLAFARPGHGFPASDQPPDGIPLFPQFRSEIETDPGFKSSYTQQTLVESTWAATDRLRVSVSYSLVQGRRLPGLRAVNPVVRPIPDDPFRSVLTGRVDPSRGNIEEYESAFGSVYHGLTLGFEHRSTDTLGFSAHFTVSKAIDDFLDLIRDDLGARDNPLQPGLDRGLSVQDVRARFVMSGRWEPRRYRHPLLRNYTLSAIVRLETGRPYNLIAGVDLNRDGEFPPGDRPRVDGVPLGRNVGITPGFASADLRVTRTLKFGDKLNLELIGEVFNLFNHTNINQVDNVFPPDALGNFHLPAKQAGRYSAPPERWRSAFAPRQFQIGFRLNF